MALLFAMFVMPITIYIVTIPVRSMLYTLQMIMSFLSLSELSLICKRARLSITIWSLLLETFWYLPLFILFITRSLRLGTKPFEEVIVQRDETFARKLFNSADRQTALNPFTNLLAKTFQFAFTTTILMLIRLNPLIRLFIPISILIYQFCPHYSVYLTYCAIFVYCLQKIVWSPFSFSESIHDCCGILFVNQQRVDDKNFFIFWQIVSVIADNRKGVFVCVFLQSYQK